MQAGELSKQQNTPTKLTSELQAILKQTFLCTGVSQLTQEASPLHLPGCERGAGWPRCHLGQLQSAPSTECRYHTSPARCRLSCICAWRSPRSHHCPAAQISPAAVLK